MEIYNAFFSNSDYVLVPDNAYEERFNKRDPRDEFLLLTADKVKVKATFLATWKNENGCFDQALNNVSKHFWNMPFEQLRSMWVARLGKVGMYWDLLKLEEA